MLYQVGAEKKAAVMEEEQKVMEAEEKVMVVVVMEEEEKVMEAMAVEVKAEDLKAVGMVHKEYNYNDQLHLQQHKKLHFQKMLEGYIQSQNL